MKNFFAAVTVIVALVIAMPTVTFAYDSIQTVNCSWWSDSRDYNDYYEEPEEEEKPSNDDED